MNIKPEWTLGIIAITAVFLGGLIFTQPDINMKHHRQYIQALNDVEYNMAMLESEVLHVKNGQRRFYDLIVYRVRELQRNAAALSHPPAFIDDNTRQQINTLLEKGKQDLTRLDTLAINFERYYSLVRNSLAYLPLLSDELARQTASNSFTQQSIFTVLQRVLVGSLTPESFDTARIRHEKEILEDLKFDGLDDGEIKLYFTHIDVVLSFNKTLKEILKQIHLITTQHNTFRAIGERYHTAHQKAVDRIAGSLKILYCVSAMLMVLISLFLLQMRHNNRSLKSAIDEITVASKALSEGDLTKRIEGSYKGQLHQLQLAFNKSIMQMASAVSRVIDVTHRVQHSSGAIASETRILARHLDEQTTHLQQSAACMSQMSAQVETSSINTRQANELTTAARNQARAGQKVMADTIDVMEEIHDSSTRMEEIITTIDTIAFQTNLLALNASVEAARSGEHGRGFAVVANEVRNLAGKSADAAKDIKELIEGSIARIAAGTTLAQQTGVALAELSKSIHQASQLMENVTVTIDSQSTGIRDVSQAVATIDKKLQDDNQRTIRAADLAMDVETLIAELGNLMQRFKVVERGESQDLTPVGPHQSRRQQGAYSGKYAA